jgi:hypothetical protein
MIFDRIKKLIGNYQARTGEPPGCLYLGIIYFSAPKEDQ